MSIVDLVLGLFGFLVCLAVFIYIAGYPRDTGPKE